MARRISGWCAVALLAFASLQTAQAKRVAAPAPAASAQDSLCDRSVSVADNTASDGNALSGSRWLISYKTQGEPARSYVFRLLPGGRMLNAHPNDRTPNNDRWESNGRHVQLRFNDGYAVYSGMMNGSSDQLKGHAVNTVGDTWEWRARRLEPCTAGR
ncbi:MAG: hypothetical protein LBJ15_09780 [Comamonas sp.]|jgi:hypothetical protein|uniref:hypothetical protein n=1 Tax=Comamonas sp. TaxID=34028 RepID=UPI0028234EF1|nr:hypothetical protein [Comamonas sp.]MDR0214278.1 hypothetical protein [Comamonas sp.]